MMKWVRAFAPLCIMVSAGAPAAAQTPAAQVATQTTTAPAVPQVGLIGMGLDVADMDRSLKFYVDGLGMKPLRRNERGDTVEQILGYPATPYPPMLELIARKTPAAAPVPATTTFKIVLSVDDAAAINEQLKRAGFSPPPVRMNPTAGGGAFFVRDPDGYNIEIVQRPPAKRPPTAISPNK